MSDEDAPQPTPRPVRPPIDELVLPQRGRDETEEGWGEAHTGGEDWYERERPPHHIPK